MSLGRIEISFFSSFFLSQPKICDVGWVLCFFHTQINTESFKYAETESKTVKPTIDQEFEQYFSVLLPSLDPWCLTSWIRSWMCACMCS